MLITWRNGRSHIKPYKPCHSLTVRIQNFPLPLLLPTEVQAGLVLARLEALEIWTGGQAFTVAWPSLGFMHAPQKIERPNQHCRHCSTTANEHVNCDVSRQFLSRRSSYAWAKNALAILRMSLAQRRWVLATVLLHHAHSAFANFGGKTI